jgi:putative copper export protein
MSKTECACHKRKVKIASGTIVTALVSVFVLCCVLVLSAQGMETNNVTILELQKVIQESVQRGDMLKLLTAVLGVAIGAIVYLVRELNVLQRETNATISRFIAAMAQRPCIYSKPPLDITPPDKP